ncbi:hypothetical protein PPYR_11404 [Photinus pyralis]|uniref:DDE Tnp4 domain-containing protein n=1 Tax=Photinus pyralis TaxID=7054 RepID=A0A5N4AB58_PHOPY|nr:hypothetical protein PPYR_11404 [Photinus pyralis]
MSQPSVSRCIKEVNEAITHFYHLIKFPTTNEEYEREKQGFMRMPNGFPGIIGAIDCTHVGIIAPPVDDVQFPAIICNSNLKILAINARFPGSVHDSGIWATSAIRRELMVKHEEGNSCWLLGDSGYPLEPWLMTPLLAPNLNEAERRYNNAHRSVRNVIERLNGVFKGRFRCLNRHRILHYSPVNAAKIINSCAVLHNLCIEREGEPYLDEQIEENPYLIDNDDEHHMNNNLLHQGRAVRNRIIRTHFMN